MFQTWIAPQDIKALVEEVVIDADKKLVINLFAAESVKNYPWRAWIYTAMGYLKGIDDRVSAIDPRNLPNHVRNWRKRTPSKSDLSRPLLKVSRPHSGIPDLPDDIHLWTGWPLFDTEMAQFEMNQWLQAAGLLRGYSEAMRLTIRDWEGELKEEKSVKEGLMKIMEWNRSCMLEVK